jgi:hypothetical protein
MHTSDETQKSNFFRRWVIFLLEAKLQEQCPTRCALFSVLRNWKVSSHSAKKPRISDQTGHGADKLSSSWGNSWWIKFRGCFFLTTHPLSSPADAPTTPASPVEVPGDPWHPWWLAQLFFPCSQKVAHTSTKDHVVQNEWARDAWNPCIAPHDGLGKGGKGRSLLRRPPHL